MAFHSQIRQDELLDTYVFHGLRNGIFVDVGAFDGVRFSNSLYFEEELGWTGLCVEPNPVEFAKLLANRPKARNVCAAASDVAGSRNFLQAGALGGFAGAADEGRIRREGSFAGTTVVETKPLRHMLAEAGLAEVHYLSIDVEGAETEVVRGIDFEAVPIHAMTIECNHHAGQRRIIDAVGPQHICLGLYGWDLYFVLRDSPFAADAAALRDAIEPPQMSVPLVRGWLGSLLGRVTSR